MVDFTSTQAPGKQVAPPANRDGGQAEATVATALSTLSLLSVDRFYKRYRQLAKMHTIIATQLVECAR
jgi:hypothetical protein